jgi:glycosyltransferase involved in cell wall biosynthesis
MKMSSNDNNEALVVVSCSAVIALKRIDLIIEALAITDMPVHWVHFGGGVLIDLIQQKAAKLLSPKPNISYELRGDTSRNTILEYYANNQVDVLLNTSEFEGIPFSMMEALSYGIPIIGTNVGGVSELISDKHNGILLTANPTPIEIAVALKYVAHAKIEEREELRKNAFETWETKFNAEKNYTQLAEQLLD